jgi:hypothetical protein
VRLEKLENKQVKARAEQENDLKRLENEDICRQWQRHRHGVQTRTRNRPPLHKAQAQTWAQQVQARAQARAEQRHRRRRHKIRHGHRHRYRLASSTVLADTERIGCISSLYQTVTSSINRPADAASLSLTASARNQRTTTTACVRHKMAHQPDRVILSRIPARG